MKKIISVLAMTFLVMASAVAESYFNIGPAFPLTFSNGVGTFYTGGFVSYEYIGELAFKVDVHGGPAMTGNGNANFLLVDTSSTKDVSIEMRSGEYQIGFTFGLGYPLVRGKRGAITAFFDLGYYHDEPKGFDSEGDSKNRKHYKCETTRNSFVLGPEIAFNLHVSKHFGFFANCAFLYGIGSSNSKITTTEYSNYYSYDIKEYEANGSSRAFIIMPSVGFGWHW